MATQLTAADARQSLTAHVAAKGAELHAKFGPVVGWSELALILGDRTFVRYPCEIKFDASPLQAGEFAHPVSHSENPEDGFTIYVHPVFLLDLPRVPYLVLYQLVSVNYGQFASSEEAEAFGANALGISSDEYYQILCEMSDLVGAPAAAVSPAIGESGGCGCSSGGPCH
jgi:hypothetical protein